MAAFGVKPVYVLDCGGQYCHLIASRVRSHEALSIIVPCDTPASELADAGAIIVSGGPQSVFDPESLRVDVAVWALPVPILGVCYGAQLMCRDLGGAVEEASVGEYGPAKLRVANGGSGVIPASADGTVVWMSHRDRVTRLPEGFVTSASTEACPHAAVTCEVNGKRLYGLQLHPEVTHTVKGIEMLGAFVTLAGLRGTWRVSDFVESRVAEIKAKAGSDKSVFVLVSGGVDSTVTYALLAKALPAERILGLYVDTGMMRKDESVEVEASLRAAGLPNLRCVDASKTFLDALAGVVEPEAKRRVIGQQFLEVQRCECAKLGLDPEKWLLGQGTIYPDTIESGGKAGKAAVIKTHHNRVPEIEALIERGLVLEPLAELYKDEVRAVGEKIGLAHHLVWRQPFPGPGLGVRLLCHGCDPESAQSVSQRAAARAAIQLRHPTLSVDVPPLRSVGCQGDARTYRNFAVIGGYKRDWQQLDELATQLVNEFADVNRVVISLARGARSPPDDDAFQLALSAGAPHTVTKRRLDLLREADAIVSFEIEKAGLTAAIWQCPVVLAPLAREGAAPGEETVILRPVDSTEAMTASFSRVPWALCDIIATRIRAELPQICDVLYDITNKPPGTIEWE